MIQEYEIRRYDRALNEVDEYCRLEGVSPLLIRRSVKKEQMGSERMPRRILGIARILDLFQLRHAPSLSINR